MGTVVNVERIRLKGGEVSFNARGGEVTVLLCREKEVTSLLLRAISGEEKKDGVVFDGENVTSLTPAMRRAVLIDEEISLKKKWSLLRSLEAFLKNYDEKGAKEMALAAIKRANVANAERKLGDIKAEDALKSFLFAAFALNFPLVLLDNPLSSLKNRRELLFFIKNLHKSSDATLIYASESVEESLIMADTLVVMHSSCVEQSAPPEKVYERPYTGYTALYVSSSSFLKAHVFTPPIVRTSSGYELKIAGMKKNVISGSAVFLSVRKEDVFLSSKNEGLRARVTKKEYAGMYTDYELSLVHTGEKLLYRAFSHEEKRSLNEGEEAFFELKAENVNVFNEEMSRSLMEGLSRYS